MPGVHVSLISRCFLRGTILVIQFKNPNLPPVLGTQLPLDSELVELMMFFTM